MNRRILLIAAAALVLLVFVIATQFYQRDDHDQTAQLVEQNLKNLVRAHSPALGNADAKVHIVCRSMTGSEDGRHSTVEQGAVPITARAREVLDRGLRLHGVSLIPYQSTESSMMKTSIDRFSVGVLAEAAGVSVETIRFYPRKRLLPESERPRGSIRRDADDDRARVRFIKAAQRLGFSLDEVSELRSWKTASIVTRRAALPSANLRTCG